jgi:hypothetical protein
MQIFPPFNSQPSANSRLATGVFPRASVESFLPHNRFHPHGGSMLPWAVALCRAPGASSPHLVMTDFISDPQQGATCHFAAAPLGDPRRTRRLVRFAAAMAEDPAGSIPRICGNWSDTKAAYRLFAQPLVTFDTVCQPHFDMRWQAAGGRFLLLDDTTELDFGKHRHIDGLGPLGNGSGRGLLLHSGLLIDPRHEALLGLAGAVLQPRVPAPAHEKASAALRRRRETDRFGELIDQIGTPPAKTEWIHVIDREGDNYEVFGHCLAQHVSLIVRVRCLGRKVKLQADASEVIPLKEVLTSLPVQAQRTLQVPAKARTRREPIRPARTAILDVRYGAVVLLLPRRCSPYLRAQGVRQIPVGVIGLREQAPPAGQARIEWVLYTTWPIDNLPCVDEAIAYYRWRWWIEEWHKVIKSGTRIKARQLESAERLKPLIGMSAIEAVRLLQLKSLSRKEPGCVAEAVVPKKYIRMLEVVQERKIATVREFFHGVARLGGFLDRKGDGEPGWQTIWHGWEKLALMIRGAEAFHDHPDSGICG